MAKDIGGKQQDHYGPWPEKGDRLFTPDGGLYNAMLHKSWTNDGWPFYIWGYGRAARLLCNHLNESRTDLDILIYPIIFLFRHFVEISLKDILRQVNALLDDSSEVPQTHDLQKLWDSARPKIEQFNRGADPEPLEVVEECLCELVSEDPFATAFRYPFDKKGEPSAERLTHVNVLNMADVMDKLSAFLDAVHTQLSVLLETKSEMEREYGL